MHDAASPDDAVLTRVAGARTMLRAHEYAAHGAVVRAQWNDQGTRVFGEVRGNARRPYTALADLTRTASGALKTFRGSCTCPVGINCKHSVALVLAARSAGAPGGAAPGWEQAIGGLLPADPSGGAADAAEIALQFELLERRAGPAVVHRIGLRPVVPGRAGRWVRSGISWSSLGYTPYASSSRHAAHLRLLGEIMALHAASSYRGYYGAVDQTIFLDDLASRRIWDLLAEAREIGLPLVHAGRVAEQVTLAAEPARLGLDVTGDADGLTLTPAISAAGESPAPAASVLLGSPVHGIGWWRSSAEPDAAITQARLRLAPLSAPAVADETIRGLLAGGGLHVPAADAERFLHEYCLPLRQAIEVTSSDDSVALPEPVRPVLVLRLRADAGRVRLSWHWRYDTHEIDLDAPAAGTVRDRAGERGLLDAVVGIVGGIDGLTERAGARLCTSADLGGMAAVRFAEHALPRLAELPDLEIDGELPDYREAAAAPVIDIAASPADRDWFDLAVSVTVEGEDVPFQALFLALAAGEPFLVLPSGTYFSLDRPELRQLAELIDEARAMQDRPGESVRVSRYQADLFDELARLGVISGQAAEWQQSVRALCDARLRAQPLPSGVEATLRPYQQSGYDWLAFLHDTGLGGILADDMGLGKTLQALALIARACERDPGAAPFLVVAPTSVVSNWASEAAKFVPGLRVATITETVARRGTAMAALAAGTDVVITSYTLFRLEYDDYAALGWSGMILDEAQFVKNHQAQGYRCAKQLPAPFKLAITGTPMENNLMELWSLCSITAPGLFPSPVRFDKYYRTPIEKGRDAELLGQLRRRIRPLMLRRAKSDVLTELPDKQEQVVELDLNPRHRRAYQRHLQRERQKVLGLLGDLDNNRFEIFRSLTLLRQASLSAALVDPAQAKIPSTKLDALMDHLDDAVGEGHRVLVFSQFTRFLDQARVRLDTAGIEHCYLDGKTRKRAAVIERFKSGAAPVFLVSLKAGGFGLNLTEADYCILLDPWWNPATEAQAVDRVHRIGQTRKVMVYRMVAKDTIEEKVMALKAAKAALFSSVMADGTFADGALSASDIRALVE